MLSILPSLPRPMVKILVGIWRRRWMVLALAWVTAIAGWLATLVIPDMYESRAQVYINTETALDNTITEVGARPNLEKQVRVIRTQLLSRDNIERVIYEVGLDSEVNSAVELERMIQEITDEIRVNSDEEQYFTISHLNTDPVMAQRIVSAVLDLFIEQNLSSAIADVDTALANLDREIAERKVRLDAVSERIADFRRENANELAGADRLARRLEAKEEELARLQDQIAASTLRRERLVTTLSSTPRYASGSDIDQLKLQLASLQSQFNSNYPDIVRLKAQIAELESGSAVLPENREYAELRTSMRIATDELQTLRGRSDRVQTEIDDLSLSVAQTPEAESELVALLRDQEQIETTYTQLIQQRNKMGVSANLNQAGGAIQYRRFEAPIVAAEPSWPPRGLMTLGIVGLALGFGGAIAFILSQLDKTYTQASDLEESLGLPVLGSVSQSPTRPHFFAVFGERAALFAGVGALFVAAGVLYWHYEHRIADDPETSDTAELSTPYVPASTAAEGIR